MDALFVLLIHSGRYSLLPELYEVFGRELLMRFLEMFGGTTITVPSERDLAKAARDVAIYCRLHGSTAQQADAVNDLCREYGIEADEVNSINLEMRRLMDRYDLRKATRKEEARAWPQ